MELHQGVQVRLTRKRNPDAIIVICTHLLEEAEVLGDEIFFLSKGQIVVSGSPAELKRAYGLGYSVKVYKKSDASSAELGMVEDYLKRVNRVIFGKSLKVKYFKTFLRVDIARDQKAHAKHILKTLELFFSRHFDFYLNSTTLDDVYFNISQIIRQLSQAHPLPPQPGSPVLSQSSNISMESMLNTEMSKGFVLEQELFAENARDTFASKVYIVSANRLEFLMKNKIQLIYYFSSVVVHLVNFYFGCVYFGQDVFLYYVVSFFAIDIFLSSYFLYGLIYEKHLRIKHFLYRKGFSPFDYFASKFFIDWLLISFQFVAYFTEVTIFYQEYRIKSRNLIFLLIGLYMWKIQFLASNYLLSLLPWRRENVHNRLSIFYYLSFILVSLLVYMYFEIFDALPKVFVLVSETVYICMLLNIRLDTDVYSSDYVIMGSLPFQLVFVVLCLALTIFIERRRLAFNYTRQSSDANASSGSESGPESQHKSSANFRASDLSRDSDNDSIESENEEECKKRMLNYIKTEQEYFLTVNDNILIKASRLRKTYAKKEVVDLTFGIEPGICLGIIGPNGAGKTTAINLLLSVVKKTAGQIEISHKARRNTFSQTSLPSEFQSANPEVTPLPKPSTDFWKEKCGVCFQEESLWNELTIEQHVEFMCRLFNIQNYDRIIGLLKYFDIYHLLNREVYKLSSGERKKLLVVLNLVNKSDFYFLDETSANLDPDSREDLRRILNKLKISYQSTIITTTHFVKGALTRSRDAVRQNRHHQGRQGQNRLPSQPAAQPRRRLHHHDPAQKSVQQIAESLQKTQICALVLSKQVEHRAQVRLAPRTVEGGAGAEAVDAGVGRGPEA